MSPVRQPFFSTKQAVNAVLLRDPRPPKLYLPATQKEEIALLKKEPRGQSPIRLLRKRKALRLSDHAAPAGTMPQELVE